MKIAAHHIKGTPEHRFSEMLRPDPEYTPACAWPDDCMVQWGHGIIPAVPFFEAFPPGTFIRGEGETIAEAERKAFAQYQSEAPTSTARHGAESAGLSGARCSARL
jgi:hypothetical protein